MSHFSDLEPTYQRRLACNPGQPPIQMDIGERYPEGKLETEHESDEYKFNSNLRPHSTPSIARWLDNNYHYEDGICLPRCTIYEHYVDYCQRESLQPVNAASFGKIIRQQYPGLTTRRLGTRGQSKYHYFGLGIKHTSRYYTADYLEKQHGQGTTKKEPESKKTHAYYASTEKPSAVLPQFPNVKILELPPNISKDKLHTFMVMYRAHCQRILDSVVRATFSEVENFLFHFWQGMPSHLLPILASDIVTDLIAVCDTTLYKAISNVYIITPLQSIPENVAQEVHHFSSSLKGWLEGALKGLPDSLRDIKLRIADVFNKSLKRQRSLMHLADATRNALHGEDPLEKLGTDWNNLDIENILTHTLFAVQPLHLSDYCANMVPEFLDEFAQVISEQNTSVEDFIVWVEGVINRCINKKEDASSVREVGRTFLLTWNFFTAKIVREFTLMSASSFGTFHLIHMLIDDYILHSLELMLENELEKQYSERIRSLESDSMEEAESKDKKTDVPMSNTTRSILKSPTSTDVPLVAEPPSAFSLRLASPRTKSPNVMARSTDISPDQTFGSILPPPLQKTGDGLRGPSVSIPVSTPLHLQQVNRGATANGDPQTEPTTLQGLISSHGIGAFGVPSLPSVTTTRDSILSQRQHALSNSTNSQSNTDLRLGGHTVASQLSSGLLSFSQTGRQQETSLSMSFTQSNPQPPLPSNLSSFGLPPLTGHLALPPHLQPDHPSPYEVANLNPTEGNLLGASSNQSRSFAQLMSAAGKDLAQNMPVSTTSNPRNEIGTVSNLHMSLPHPIMAASGNLPGGLSNPSALPLLPGMPNMYSYPYPAPLPTLPSHSVSNALPRPPTFPMPAQGLPRYPPYMTPSLYGNTQPPITNRNFSS